MNKERWGGNKELKAQIKAHKAYNKEMATRLEEMTGLNPKGDMHHDLDKIYTKTKYPKKKA